MSIVKTIIVKTPKRKTQIKESKKKKTKRKEREKNNEQALRAKVERVPLLTPPLLGPPAAPGEEPLPWSSTTFGRLVGGPYEGLPRSSVDASHVPQGGVEEDSPRRHKPPPASSTGPDPRAGHPTIGREP